MLSGKQEIFYEPINVWMSLKFIPLFCTQIYFHILRYVVSPACPFCSTPTNFDIRTLTEFIKAILRIDLPYTLWGDHDLRQFSEFCFKQQGQSSSDSEIHMNNVIKDQTL
jgi:hypothetical protein